ncbi:hypothetical protein Tco_0298989 [Tanacetum coccineum]
MLRSIDIGCISMTMRKFMLRNPDMAGKGWAIASTGSIFVSLTSSVKFNHQGTVSLQKWLFRSSINASGNDQPSKLESFGYQSTMLMVPFRSMLHEHAVAIASAQNDNGSLEAESIVRAASTRVKSLVFLSAVSFFLQRGSVQCFEEWKLMCNDLSLK